MKGMIQNMRILLIDIDTLRADHLGCYGYNRNTSPNIDSIAQDGSCFTDYYCSDAPCLPSRAAAFTGRFGFHTGVVAHDGTAADIRLEGAQRNFRDKCASMNLPAVLRTFGMHTASISTFPERHSAWWFNAGFNETYNLGKGGDEIAQEVTPIALDWLDRNTDCDNWFLHVHYWDPHTDYRTPSEIGNPFDGQPSSSIEWIDDKTLEQHRQMTGFHTASELMGFSDDVKEQFRSRQLGQLMSLDDVRKNVDSYDCGIYNADLGVGQLIAKLKELGIYEDTAIIVTADHGEDMGELGRYSEHGCADYPVTRLPFVIKWPGGITGGKKVGGFHYNVDLLPTLVHLLKDKIDYNIPYADYMKKIYGDQYKEIYFQSLLQAYDGENFAQSILTGNEHGREYLVVSCATHTVQRAVRFDDYIYIRTYHDGYCQFPEDMLFHIKDDPHQTRNLADTMPELVHKATYLMEKWTSQQMHQNAQSGFGDPIWTVIGEGGPTHVKGQLENYLQRLERTGRHEQAEALREKYPSKK